jgi:predicted pyridoxine 5'-phosphate oxidase superfamily flavin-nucleotide-binding protein
VRTDSFHDGELAVQARAGHTLSGRIKDSIPPIAATFLATHGFCVVAGSDPSDRIWTSMLCGPAGFLGADDERTMRVDARPLTTDPLHHLLTSGGDVGTIVMDSRRRMRVNGVLAPTTTGFSVHTEQVFSNCGRYISDRQGTVVPSGPGRVTRAAELSSDQMRLVRGADTFYIGTRHPDGAADASHRGGNPGFVLVDSPNALRWPDYDGNAMFMTLGNLALDPRVGLLFLDWAEGTVLQVSGRADLDWSARSAAQLPGAQRVVRMTIDAVQQTEHAVPMRWAPPVLSRFNPTEAGAHEGEAAPG